MTKKKKWAIGDVAMIPRADGRFVPAQIVDVAPRALNSVVLAIFDEPIEGGPNVDSLNIRRERVFSVVFATRDLLDNGDWTIIGNVPVALHDDLIPSKKLQRSGFVGAKVYGSAIIENFISAYYALVPWDMYYTPDYFDKMLISPQWRPKTLMSKDHGE